MFYHLFKLIQPLFPKDTYITWDNLFEKDAEPIDGWTMFQYLQKNGYRSKYVIRKDSPFYKKLKQNKQTKDVVVIKNSNKNIFDTLFVTLLRAKVIIKPFLYNYRNGCWSDKKLKKNKYIQDVYVDHGVNYLKKNAYYMFNPDISNIIVISNNYEKEIYYKAGWPYERMIKGGLCRWDRLRKENCDAKKILIFFTWRGSIDRCLLKSRLKNEPDFHPAKSTYVSGIQNLITNKKLHEACNKLNIEIEVGVHHAAIDNAKIPLFSFYAPNVKLVDMQSISKHIYSADLVITDRSSMIFDPMFVNTPILFYTPDKNNPALNKWEHEEEEYSIKLEKETMYNYCDTIDDIIEKIESYAKNEFQLEIENQKINDTFFYYKKDICKYIIENIEKQENSNEKK